MEVTVMIAEFKQHLKTCGYTRATVACYSGYLTLFKHWLLANNITDLKAVTCRVIADYHAQVMARPLAIESKALYIRPVKRLFEHLLASNRLLIDPTEGIVETHRRGCKLAPVLTVEEMQRLLNQPNLSLRSQIRDRAIMEVLYSTAIRLNELLALQVYHVDLADKVLFIKKGKGRRQRVVPLGKQAVKFLKEYLVNIRPRWIKRYRQERRLFLNNRGRAISGANIRFFIRVYRLAAGIKKPVSPHTFRRSCATHLMRQGADIRYVQELLGHVSLKTTQVYAQAAAVDVKQTHAKTHPNRKAK